MRNDQAAANADHRLERRELASCYRLFDHLGWAEAIFNHITLRVGSGDDVGYLINSFGLHYSEVEPGNLMFVGLDGQTREQLSPGRSEDSCSPPRGAGAEVGGRGPTFSGRLNRAGLVIHSAIHGARRDAHCIMHTHTTAGSAVAAKQSGLRADNFYSAMLDGAIGYHDYEGVTTRDGEQGRLVASLGDKNYLILRNHGLLTVGATVAQAFHRLWTLQRACEIQLASDGGAGPNITIPAEVLKGVPASRLGVSADRNDVPQMMFDAMLRKAGIAF